MTDSDCIFLLFLYIFQYIYSSKISLIQYFFKFLFPPFNDYGYFKDFVMISFLTNSFQYNLPLQHYFPPTTAVNPSQVCPHFILNSPPSAILLPCPEHHATSKQTVFTTYTTVATTKTSSSEPLLTNNSSSICFTNTTKIAK